MFQLILIDVALCALLVVVAGCIMLWRRRRGRDQAGDRQGTAAELAGDERAAGETAVVPGFGHDLGGPDPDAGASAEPEQATPSQVSTVTGTAPDPDERATEPNGARPQPNEARPPPNGLRVRRDGLRVEPQANGAAGQAPDQDGQDVPRAASNGQPAAAGAGTASDPIGSYYDEADRAMADYLAAMGWTEEPERRLTE
jgi:hypothetical protein